MQHYSDRSFIEQYPLSPRKIWKKMVARTISSAMNFIILNIFLGPALFAGYGVYLEAMGRGDEMKGNTAFLIKFAYTYAVSVALFFILLRIISYFYQRQYIKTYYYNFTDTLLVIRKGVFTKQEITVPFERIQDVYIDQDLLDLLFGLYDVHISTAPATSGFRAHIDGFEKKDAEQLRTLILSKID